MQGVNTSWFSVCGDPSERLAKELSDRVASRRAKGDFSIDNQKYVEKVSLSATRGAFSATAERIELLRKLCAIYAVDFKPQSITSHRPVIGKTIVFCKKALFQIVRPLIAPALRQQRDFNASVIYLLTDLCNESSHTKDRPANS